MNEILDKYRKELNYAEVQAGINDAMALSKEMMSDENFKKLFSFIDLTFLNTTDYRRGIAKVTRQVNHVKPVLGIDNVAAICVYPRFVSTVKDNLEDDKVGIAAVVGGFPASQTFLEVKRLETKMVFENGATEADMVISVGEFLDGGSELLMKEVAALKEEAGDGILKVILETGVLNDLSLIYKASILAMEAGADFIKTSTGKEKVGATPESVYVMAMAIKDYYDVTGRKVGLKPAGGVSTPENGVEYMAIVKQVIGEEWLTNELFRIGSSSLADKVLKKLGLTEDKFFSFGGDSSY